MNYSSTEELSELLSCSNKQTPVRKAKNMSCFIWLLNTGLTVLNFLSNSGSSRHGTGTVKNPNVE